MDLKFPKDELPKHGEYVLAYFGCMPWGDDNDTKGNRFWKTVRFNKGLSQKERDLLPDDHERKTSHQAGDEGFNNLVGYNWEEHGPGSHFGQECMFWCHLPDVSRYKMHEAHKAERKSIEDRLSKSLFKNYDNSWITDAVDDLKKDLEKMAEEDMGKNGS